MKLQASRAAQCPSSHQPASACRGNMIAREEKDKSEMRLEPRSAHEAAAALTASSPEHQERGNAARMSPDASERRVYLLPYGNPCEDRPFKFFPHPPNNFAAKPRISEPTATTLPIPCCPAKQLG